MTRKPLRWFMVIMLTGMVSAISIYGISSIDGGSWSILLAIVTAVLAIVTIAGVEMDYIEYGAFRIQFTSDGRDDDE